MLRSGLSYNSKKATLFKYPESIINLFSICFRIKECFPFFTEVKIYLTVYKSTSEHQIVAFISVLDFML